MPAHEVQLSRVAPAVLPHVAVYPHPGLPVSQRPWVRGPEARQDPLTAGWHAGTPVVSSHPVAGRPAWPNGATNFAPRPMTGASAPAPVYGRPAPSFAGRPSAGAPMAFAPRPSPGFQPAPARAFNPPPAASSFQAPAPRTSHPAAVTPVIPGAPASNYAPPAPRSFAPPPPAPAPRSFAPPPPPPAARSFAPPPHAFTPPPSSGGFNHVAGTAASGGVHFGAQPNHHR